ncbi:MAG: hypothetical protein QOH21_3144 [Acidobacteriota bacterium]|nr:hypothetical protein [Acidobacteriota bacterium]
MGEEYVHFASIVVRFDIADDGALHVTERADLEIPAGVTTAERWYWADAEQRLTFNRLTRVDGTHQEERFQSPGPGIIKWQVSPGTATYVIEFTVADGVIPACSIPRGRLTHDASGLLSDPKQRARALLDLWREAAANPRRRYLVDYQYQMPPVSEQGTDIELQLYWSGKWEPVHTITGDTIARKIEHDAIETTRWRVTHLFDYSGDGTPAAIDVRYHFLRALFVAGFPVACLLLWLAFFLREFVRRGPAAAGEVDERFLQDTLYSEAPEVIAAQWNGKPPYPSIERFLRRLEKRGKLRIGIEQRGDEQDPLVTLRLLAPREQLTSYERAGIDALIPEGWETTSDAIAGRRGDDGFDPTESIRGELQRIAIEYGAKNGSPWYSKLTSFALFAGGIYLLLLETVRYQREPALLAGGLIFTSMLTSVWPNLTVRRALRDQLRWALVLLVPALVCTAAMVFVYIATERPPGLYAAAGLSLMLLATYKAVLAATATREPAPVRQRLRDLTRARTFLRAELKREHPRVHADAAPWLQALGLRAPAGARPAPPDEGWGESLVA